MRRFSFWMEWDKLDLKRLRNFLGSLVVSWWRVSLKADLDLSRSMSRTLSEKSAVRWLERERERLGVSWVMNSGVSFWASLRLVLFSVEVLGDSSRRHLRECLKWFLCRMIISLVIIINILEGWIYEGFIGEMRERLVGG